MLLKKTVAVSDIAYAVVALCLAGVMGGCMIAPEQPTDFDPRLGVIDLAVDEDDFADLVSEPSKRGAETEINATFAGMFRGDTILVPCALRIHGGTSRSYPKKSFRLYFRDIPLASSRLFEGFPSYEGATNSFSELVLNANAIDFSNMRNYLAMLAMGRLGGIVPRVSFVRLTFNGAPYGLYTAIERVNADMATAVLGHATCDLLKSQGLDGNLSTVDFWTGDTGQSAAREFSIIVGDTASLCEFVDWIESSDFSYAGVKTRCHLPCLFAHFMGCLYSGDRDALVKNFYFLYDKLRDVAYFIPWDADATFGRNWCGGQEPADECGCPVNRNGLYRRLMKDAQWRADVAQRFSEAFSSELSPAWLEAETGDLEALLTSAVQQDNVIWKDTLLDYFVSQSGVEPPCSNILWDDSPSDPLRIWTSEMDYVTSFIESRPAVINRVLE